MKLGEEAALNALSRIFAEHKDRAVLKDGAAVGILGVMPNDSRVESTPRNRDIVTLATSDAVDSAREVIVPTGVVAEYYRANGANFVDHRYDLASCVAKLRTFHFEKSMRGWVNRSSLLPPGNSALADLCWNLAEQMGIGASIGFEAPEYTEPRDTDPPHYLDAERVIRKCRILEVSFTMFPCNVTCQGMAVPYEYDYEKRMGQLDSIVTKSGVSRYVAHSLGLPKTMAPRPVINLAARPRPVIDLTKLN